MEQDHIVLDRFEGIEDRGQLFVLDIDQAQSFFGAVLV
jgi:hypothetical protein